MRKFRLFTLIALCPALFVLGACSMKDLKSTTLSETSTMLTYYADPAETGQEYQIVLEKLNFLGNPDISVEIFPAEQASVQVFCSEDFPAKGLEVHIEDDEIRVFADADRFYKTASFKVYIKANFSQISLNGSFPVTVNATGIDALDVTFNGAVSCDLSHLSATSLAVTQNGTGLVELSGTAQNANILLAGAGAMEGRNLISRDATVEINGVGNLALSVTDLLTVSVSGVGSIDYYGSPEVVKQTKGICDIVQKATVPYPELPADTSAH